MKTPMRNLFAALVLLSALNLQPSTAFAQSMVFTFQGRVPDSGQQLCWHPHLQVAQRL
jgi:hypothetical protein